MQPDTSPWSDPARVRQLKVLQAKGLTFAQIAKEMGLSRMTVGNKLRRLRLGKAANAGARVPRDTSSSVRNATSDGALVETWASRKARLAAQRQGA